MPTLHSLSVILPVLNERDNLAELIPELISSLQTKVNELEVIVVDDSSTDGTSELVQLLASQDRRVRLISRVGKPASLPQSIEDGVLNASHPHVAWMDADGSMPPDALCDLVDRFRAAEVPAPIVVGSRFVAGGGFKGVEVVGKTSMMQVIRNLKNSNDSLSAVILSRVLNRYLWLGLNRCCRDLASGFIVAGKQDVTRIGLRGSYGDYCVRFIFLAHRAGMPIIEVPYVCQVRRHGYSKTGTTLLGLLQRGLPYVMLPFRVRFRR